MSRTALIHHPARAFHPFPANDAGPGPSGTTMPVERLLDAAEVAALRANRRSRARFWRIAVVPAAAWLAAFWGGAAWLLF